MRVDRSSGEICGVITTHGTAPLLAGDIHGEPAGAESGPVVVPLMQVSDTKLQGCAVGPRVADGLVTEADETCLDVHNAESPGGDLGGDRG